MLGPEQIVPATSSTLVLKARFLSSMASYDEVGNICPAPPPAGADDPRTVR